MDIPNTIITIIPTSTIQNAICTTITISIPTKISNSIPTTMPVKLIPSTIPITKIATIPYKMSLYNNFYNSY